MHTPTKMSHKLIPCMYFHLHQSFGQLHEAPLPSPESIPSPALFPKGDPWAHRFQVGYMTKLLLFLITKGKFTPSQEILLPLAFLLPATATHAAGGTSYLSCWIPCCIISQSQIATADSYHFREVAEHMAYKLQSDTGNHCPATAIRHSVSSNRVIRKKRQN